MPVRFLNGDILPVSSGSAFQLDAVHGAKDVLVPTSRIENIDFAPVALFR